MARKPSIWPLFAKRETLAACLDIEPAYVDQLVKRGVLPRPVRIGEADRWLIEDVKEWLRQGNPYVEVPDPYLTAVGNVTPAKARGSTTASRPSGKGEGAAVLLPRKG